MPDHAEYSPRRFGARRAPPCAARWPSRFVRQRVAGLAFDATCSLVRLDAAAGRSASRPPARRMECRDVGRSSRHRGGGGDHGHRSSRTRLVGGAMSPEMELPKLLWLHRHLPQAWPRYGWGWTLLIFWPGARRDGLRYLPARSRASGLISPTRRPGWQRDLFDVIGLDDLPVRTHAATAAVSDRQLRREPYRGRGRRAWSHGAVRGRRRSDRRACRRARAAAGGFATEDRTHAWR